MTRLNNEERDKLMRNPDTLMISSTKAYYHGKKYTFKAVTREELINKFSEAKKQVNKVSHKIILGEGIINIIGMIIGILTVIWAIWFVHR